VCKTRETWKRFTGIPENSAFFDSFLVAFP
jgi:hypothetical protein